GVRGGVSINGSFEFFAQLGQAGNGFAQLALVLQIIFLAARQRSHHVPQSRRHGASSRSSTAAARDRSGRGELLDERLSAGAQSAHRHLSAHDRSQAIFQNQRRIEIFYLQEPLGGFFQGFFGYEADNLTADGFN